MTADPDTRGSSADRVLVIACGMLAREVLAVRQQAGLDHLDLTCLPAEFHFRPDRIPHDPQIPGGDLWQPKRPREYFMPPLALGGVGGRGPPTKKQGGKTTKCTRDRKKGCFGGQQCKLNNP